jgi:gliding motility-associated-like protein
VALSANYDTGKDFLDYTDANGIAGSYENGTLTLSGNASPAGYTAALRAVMFRNDNPSSLQRTVTFTIAGGSFQTRAVSVTPVDDAPVVSGIEAGTLAYTENGGAVAISSSITVTDAENDNLNGATVAISDNYDTDKDFLDYTETNGISGIYSNGTLTLSGSASPAGYTAALRAVKFRNDSDNPSTATRTVTFTISGGSFQTRTVSVTAVDDAPVVSGIEAGTLAYTENGGAVAISSAVTVTDAENDNLNGATVAISANYDTDKDVLDYTETNGISGIYSNGTLTLSGSASPAGYTAALRAVKFRNDSDNPSTATRTVTFTISGGSFQTRTVSVTAVDDAPVVSGIEAGTLAYTENGGAVAISSAVTVTDAENDNLNGATVAISANYDTDKDFLDYTETNGISGIYSNGTLTLSGSASPAGYTAALRAVKFRNDSDNPSTATRTVTFTISGGSFQTRAVSVTPVDDAPVVSGIEAGTLAYTENGGAVAISSAVTVTDAENDNLNGATVAISANYDTDKDFLDYTNANGITGSYENGTLTLSGSASPAGYTAALRAVKFRNDSDNPSTATRTVTFTISGGSFQTRTVSVTAVDDAPVVSGIEAGTLAYTENGGAVAISSSITVTDAENDNLNGATVAISDNYDTDKDFLDYTETNGISGIYSNGTLTLSGSASPAGYTAALRAVKFRNDSDNPSTATRTVTFTISGGSFQTRTVSVTAVDDAPVVSGIEAGTLAYTENGGAVAISSAVTVTDAENDNLNGATVAISANYDTDKDFLDYTETNGISGIYSNGTLTLSGSASPAGYTAALRAVKFRNDSDNPSTATRTVTFTISGGSFQTRTVSVTAVDDAPVVSGIEAGTLAYTENGGAVAISSAVTVTDAENDNLNGATVAISANYDTDKDFLDYTETNGISGIYSNGTLTLSGSASPAGYTAALRAVKFRNDSDNPSTATRTVTFTISGGSFQTRTVSVTAVDDAPVVSGIEAGTLAYTENGGAVAISSAVTVTDAENDNLNGATVAISANYDTDKDFLDYTETNGISSIYSSGTLTLSGSASPAGYTAALRAVKFRNDSDNPSTATRTVTFTISGGSFQTRTVSVTAVNDAPTVSSFGASGNEDVRLYLSQANFSTNFTDADGNTLSAIKFTKLPTNGYLKLINNNISENQEIAYSDIPNLNFAPDLNWNGITTCQWTGSDGTVFASNPADITLTIIPVNDLPTVSEIVVSADEDQTILFTQTHFTSAFTDVDGTLSKIKVETLPANGLLKLNGTSIIVNQEIASASLSQIRFEPNSNWFGNTNFKWNGSDGDAYATQNATVSITINPINDLPVLQNIVLSTNEDEALPFTASNFTNAFSDIESSLSRIKIVTLPANGTIKQGGSNISENTEINVADLSNLTYSPIEDFHGIDAFTWNGSDGTDYANANASVTITVSAVNDAPTFTSAANTSTSQGSAYTYNITAVDIESSAITITAPTLPTWLTLTPTGAGQATLTGTPGQAQVGNHNVVLRVSDGSLFTDQTFVLNVANVNDAPTFKSTPITAATEDIAYSYTITTEDIDGTTPNISAVSIPSWLTLVDNNNGTALLSGIPSNDNVGTFNITLKVSDSLLEQLQSFQVSVANVNDQPIINSQKTLTVAEDNTITVTLSDLNVTDVDNNYPDGFSLQIATSTDYTVSGNMITPASNVNGELKVQIRVSDGETTNNWSQWFELIIMVTPVNDAPTLTGIETTTLTYIENASATIVTSSIAANDVDNTQLSSATITINGYVDGQDVLSYTNVAPITGNWNSSTGTITLTGLATLAQYTTALRSIRYQNTSDNPATTARTITFTVNDGTANSAAISRSLQVQAVNDAPVATSFNQSTKENQVKEIDLSTRVTDAENNINWNTLSVTQAATKGSTSVNTSTKTIAYTPNPNQTGNDSFNYTVCDLQNACSTGTITILISNEAPDPANDSYSINEDTPSVFDVLANDTDPQGNLSPQSITIIKAPAKGSATITSDFKVLYTPTTNYNGSDEFDYQICDLTGYCSHASVTITINAVNDAPTINNDLATTNEDTFVIIDVLANDNDDKDLLGGIDASTLTVTASPLNGTAVIEAGKIKYTPQLNYNGTDIFTYRVSDKGYPLPALSGEATVSITINAVNDNPVITGQTAISTNEDEPITLLLSHLTVTDVDNPYPTNFTLTVLSGSNYSVTGTTVVPAANYHGSLTVPVRVNDGMPINNISNTFNLLVTVTPVNDAPVAVDDYVYTGENTPINFAVLGNDSDPFDPLGGINSETLQITTYPKNGSAVILPNKNINYTPYMGFSGKDTIEYTISDLGYPLPAKSAKAKVYIEVYKLSPLANDDEVSTPEDTPVVIDLVANDTDSGNDINPNSVTIIAQPQKGTLSAATAGKVTYTPALNYFGTDFFTYTVKDFTNLTSNVAKVAITISPVNDAPEALSKAFNTPENVELSIAIANITSDIDGNIDYASFTITQQPASGSASIDAALNKLVYQPNSGFSNIDYIKFKISDSSGAISNEGTITIQVSNQAPTANNDAATTPEDVAVTINVVANDTDPQNNINPLSVALDTQPQNGIVVVNEFGEIVYTPSTNFNGSDSFSYRVCDMLGYCDGATVVVTVLAVNDPPVANNDSFDLFEDTQAALNILANDTDPENNIAKETLSIVTQPQFGTLEVNLIAGTVTYKPADNYYGTDAFTYQICDSEGACSNIATVQLTILSVNDAPNAIDDNIVGYSGIPVSLSLWKNDIDVDNNLDPSTITITTPPTSGVAEIKPGGIVVYTANTDFTGSDSFEYSICDTEGECDRAWAKLSVFSGNVAPTTNKDYITTHEDVAATIKPLLNDTDPNGNLDASTLRIVEHPSKGVAVLNVGTGEIAYTPNTNINGTDRIIYEVCDNDINMPLCTTDTIFITIIPVNDAPVAFEDQFATTDNVTTVFNVLSNDMDIDGDQLFATLTNQPVIDGISYNMAPNGDFTITPALGRYCLTVSFIYQACDPQGLCSSSTITVNITPLDSDGDGAPDYIEGLTKDTDNDGKKDYLDDDSDGDGINDKIELGIADPCYDQPLDTDGDGIPDYLDTDSDNDGVSDKEEGTGDCDNDGIPNFRDYFDDCNNRIKVPNTFSPNNDGVNDYWIIPIVTDYPTNELVVFNRWGNEIYRMSNYNNTDRIWDGRPSKSSLGTDVLPEGTYYYILTLGDGDAVLQGSIYIKR